MPEPSTIALFALASLALAVIPGPAVLYIVARSVRHGPRAGIVGAFGVSSGGLVHVTAAAVGVSSLIASSANAFTVVKLCGAAYLLWLGARTLLRGDDPGTTPAPGAAAPAALRRVWLDGVVVNVLNPKTALFFLAFLPQFVDPARGSVTAQVLAFGLIFLVVVFVSDATYALLAGVLARRARDRAPRFPVTRWLSGTVLLALGVVTALTGRGHTGATASAGR